VAGRGAVGDENEAVVCMDTLWEAFRKHPGVKSWVKERVGGV